MPERYDVIVVGAGVVGCSVAFHLAGMGRRRVCVLEGEGMPACGSTAKANGGIRAQFTTAVNVRMSLASMEILDGLAPAIGEPPLYRKAGYLFLTADPVRLEGMTAAAALQRSLGVAVDVLDAAAVRRTAPFVAAGDLVGGTFGARDGFIDPGGLASFFLREATASGVRLRTSCAATAVRRDPSGDLAVRTLGGDLYAPVVVDAAGTRAARLAATLGVELPVEPVRRHIVVSGPCPAWPPVIPMTIDADSGVLVRREGDRVAVASSNPEEPPGCDDTFDPDFPLRLAGPLEHRFPAVAAAGVDLRRSWAGLYAVTPDHHAILGEVAGHPGFVLACGFSGHGVMHAPAVGRAIAELIVTGASRSVDITPLALERFSRGGAIDETMVL